MTRITVRNNIFQHIQVLKTNRTKRNRYGEFVVEGVRNINEAVKNGWQIRSFLYGEGKLSDWAKELLTSVKTKENYQFSQELMKELSSKEDTSELMALVAMKEITPTQMKLSSKPFLVLFDRPSNKGNLGTMIRSCDALYVDALILTGHGVDLYEPEVVAASMGSFFALPVLRIAEQETLYGMVERFKKEYGTFLTVGSTAHQQKAVYELELTSPLLLFVGNETKGLSYAYKELCDELCTIPMAETSAASSFNVSCAASIMMYEVVRQRSVQ
ncbi:MAG: RNA methyltransferase [Lachnospiraceae bacterium]|nr:RNA methyltransferase [Lachnospiraceae bacterium]